MFALAAASALLFVAFGVQQGRRHRRDGSALVPPTLFAHRSFRVGVVVVMLAFSGITSFFLVLTYHMQLGLDWSALRTALVTVAFPIGIMATFQIAWRKGTANGRKFVAIGTSVMTLGTLAMILAVSSQGAGIDWYHVAGAELIVGLGMGLCSPILTNVVLGDIPPQDAGAGSGVVNAVIQFRYGRGHRHRRRHLLQPHGQRGRGRGPGRPLLRRHLRDALVQRRRLHARRPPQPAPARLEDPSGRAGDDIHGARRTDRGARHEGPAPP